VVAAENVRPGWDASGVWYDDDALLVRLRWRERTAGWRWSQHTLAVEVDDAGHSLLAVGSAAGAARLVLAAAHELEPVVRTSLPRGTHEAVRRAATARGVPVPWGTGPVTAWDWYGTTEPPPEQRGEEQVVELSGPDGRAAVTACLAVAHPAGELAPDEPRSRWWGWTEEPTRTRARDGGGGAIRAVAGASRRIPGQPWVLGSVGTDPGVRGRGRGAGGGGGGPPAGGGAPRGGGRGAGRPRRECAARRGRSGRARGCVHARQ
jgi:hypothetical protein